MITRIRWATISTIIIADWKSMGMLWHFINGKFMKILAASIT